MFDIGWPELLVIATILIVVVGPKDLPAMLRAFGRTVSKVRGMAAEFRGQFDEALREAELDDVRKAVDDVRDLNPKTALREAMAPFREAGKDMRKALDESDDDGFEPFDSPVMEPLDEPVVEAPEPAAKPKAKSPPKAPVKPSKAAAPTKAKAASAKAAPRPRSPKASTSAKSTKAANGSGASSAKTTKSPAKPRSAAAKTGTRKKATPAEAKSNQPTDEATT